MSLSNLLPAPASDLLGDLFKVVAISVGALALREVYLYATSTTEQRSIRASARAHRRNGATVLADHIGWTRPPKMNGRIADVVAVYDEDAIIVEEHETERSVNRRHSREQDRDLRRWAARQRNVWYEQIVAK